MFMKYRWYSIVNFLKVYNNLALRIWLIGVCITNVNNIGVLGESAS